MREELVEAVAKELRASDDLGYSRSTRVIRSLSLADRLLAAHAPAIIRLAVSRIPEVDSDLRQDMADALVQAWERGEKA